MEQLQMAEGTAYAVFVAPSGSEELIAKPLNVGDVNDDGQADVAFSTTFHDVGAASVYVFFGPVSPGEHALEEADAVIRTQSWKGMSPVNGVRVPDLTGDGHDDLILSTPRADVFSYQVPAIYAVGMVIPLPLEPGEHHAEELASTTFINPSPSQGPDLFWPTRAAGCDLNGDGRGDVVVGTVWSLALYYGTLAPVLTRDDADLIIEARDKSKLGLSDVDCGDVDGDGFDDLVVGDYQWWEPSDWASNHGAVFVIRGPITGPVNIDEHKIVFGPYQNSGTGMFVRVLGDLDRDGREEYVFRYGAELWLTDGAGPEAAAHATRIVSHAIDDDNDAEYLLRASNTGDIDGDGLLDFVVPGVASVYVIYGKDLVDWDAVAARDGH